MDPINPIQIPPKSVYQFLVKVDTAGVGGGGGADLESMPIQATVVTSSGQFGKAGYDSSMNSGGDEVVANIFLGKHAGNILKTNINSTRMMKTNTIDTFEVWLVDFGTDPGNIIKGVPSRTNLIINIPRLWEVQLPISTIDNPDWIISHYSFPDDSSQIVGRLQNDISVGGTRIQFDMKAPNIAFQKMYVMHATANGITDDGFTVSPLAEIVLQVYP